MNLESLSHQPRSSSSPEALPSFSQQALARLAASLNAFAEQLSASVLERGEPSFNQVTDRHGQTRWEVYDPSTDTRQVLATEAEALSWIEKARR